MAGANVPRNLKYDQSDQSTLAETLISKQAPEGRTSSFKPLNKIDIRIPTSGGFVDSFASSTLNFDLDINCVDGGTPGFAYLDPYLGAHQLIQRIVVTAGGNIIEDTTNYPMCVKLMKALHGHESRLQIDAPLSEDVGAHLSSTNQGNALQFWHTHNIVAAKTTQRYKVRLNLMSCIGSLSAAKYWPSALMDSDIRLEIYLNSLERGMILSTASLSWEMNNVEFQLTRVRLNTRVIDALKSSAQSGGVKMIMPGFSHYQETLALPEAVGNTTSLNTRYSSSASSLKSILITFRNQTHDGKVGANSYQFYDPIGLEYQFLIGSTLMPARPVNTSVDKYRELMRCMGGPINSLGQRNLISNPSFNQQMRAAQAIIPGEAGTPGATETPACHIIGQSLEMYADHTLSSTVFSGINSINLTMQCQMKITTADGDLSRAAFATKPDNVIAKVGAAGTNKATSLLVDSILVFDRLLNFTGTEVTMGY